MGREFIYSLVAGFVFFALALGWAMSGFQPNIELACALWVITFIALAYAFWKSPLENRFLKAAVVFILAIFIIWITKTPVATEYNRENAPPSFVFVMPGVWLSNNAWDFIVQHKGFDPNYHVEIAFVDEVKRKLLVDRKQSLTAADINAFNPIYDFPEIDPRGRQGIFATQFLWSPPVPNHESYEITITSRERLSTEHLQIERVGNKWSYDIEVKDAESGVTLLDCQDSGFPHKRLVAPCFPNIMKND